MITNTVLLNRQATNWFRGMAAIMVVFSHYAEWWAWFTPSEGNTELLRIAISKLGDYGVALFFLFSGYGLVKSIGEGKMNRLFIFKRIKTVYLPYFLVVGMIELLSGGFENGKDFLLFASGYDYWYMFVLFIFYIGFILIWAIVRNKAARVIIFSVFTYAFSYYLYSKDMYDFWYVSNIAFVLGVAAGEYEPYFVKLKDKAGTILILVLSAAMYFVVSSGMKQLPELNTEPAAWEVLKPIAAVTVWTVLVLLIAAKWKIYDQMIIFLGKSSLYIYLTHTVIFMQCVNYFEFSFFARFAIAAVITAGVSALCAVVIPKLFQLIPRREKKIEAELN